MVRAADGVNLEIQKGEVLGLVGESGCGKSVTALSIMYLIPSPPGRIASGEIWFQGVNLLAGIQKEAYLRKGFRGKAKIVQNQGLLRKHRARMSKVRGREMSMIFQEPMASLNPVLSIGYQIAEVLIYQRRKEICDRLLAGHELAPDDLDLFRQAVTNPDPAERERFLAEFCLRIAVPVSRVTAIVEGAGLSLEERVEQGVPRVPAVTQRRDATAGDDRDGARMRPRHDDRGRADDVPGRHDASPNPPADPGSSRTYEVGDPVHHARPRGDRGALRPRRGDVRRQDRRRCVRQGPVRRAASSVHPGAARIDRVFGQAGLDRSPAAHDRRDGARPRSPADGGSLPSP